MAKRKAKVRLMGHVVKVNRTGQKGIDNWTQLGSLFNTRGEAQVFAARHKERFGLPLRVEGVRLNIVPLSGTKERD
jgi:hypothetical protein